MTAFAALLVPLLVTLGVWQLGRADEKRHQQELVFTRLGMLPITAPGSLDDMQFRRLRLSGGFETDRYFLLDNQVYRGTPGYWVIASFLADDGRRWLINRGWVEAPRRREQLPEVAAPRGQLVLVGIVWPDLGLLPLLVEDVWPNTWPKRVQRMNAARMAHTLDDAAAAEIRLEAGQPGALQPAALQTGAGPDRHLGYAAQWFGLALVMIVGYMMFGLKSDE